MCKRVRVEGICHIGVATLHAIHSIKYATNQEGVAVAAASEARAEGVDGLQVSVMELDEENYFLVETLRVQSGIEQPEAGLIHRKLHLENQTGCKWLRTKNMQ